jgi:hypothetical protein
MSDLMNKLDSAATKYVLPATAIILVVLLAIIPFLVVATAITEHWGWWFAVPPAALFCWTMLWAVITDE